MNERITVFVQAAPEERASWARARESIEASDIGTAYEVLRNPPNVLPREHFLAVLRTMAEAPTELCLRLEDDCLVNQYILWNLSQWWALGERDFGAGWAYSPVPYVGRWWKAGLHGAVGVLLVTAHVPELIDQCRGWYAQNPSRTGRDYQDIALSHAVWRAGRRIYLHSPPLVEHQWDAPSVSDHTFTRQSGSTEGRFAPDWRAPD